MPPIGLSKDAEPTDNLRNDGLLTFTLTLSGPALSVRLWDPLPTNVVYVPGSLTPPAVYSPTAHAVIWHGVLPTDTAQIFHFRVTPALTGTARPMLALPIFNVASLTETMSATHVSAAVMVNGLRVYLPLAFRSP
jgi:hypothetical protein